MKTTYLVWKDPFCNGVNPEWQELTGQEFLAFIRLDENKKRRFIKLYSTSDDGSDGDIMIEATEEAYDDWKKEKNRSDYLRRCNEDYTVLSYHAMETEDGCYGEELLPDESVNVEDDCFLTMDKKMLKAALAQLTETEKQLIDLFYRQEKSQPEIAEMLGITQQAISKRMKKILIKLRKLNF